MAKYIYRVIRAELWGNARDGFDNNQEHTVHTITRHKPLSERFLTTVARNCFEGHNFAWTENKSVYMCRVGISLEYTESGYDVMYRGYYVGNINIEEVVSNAVRAPKEQIA